MRPLQIELPPELRMEIARLAATTPGGESAWVAEAIREKLAAQAAAEHLSARAERGDRAFYERILAKVPITEPLPGDEI